MIVCLFGSTLSGKTTIARVVAAQLDIALRSCGDEVRVQARALGTNLEDLPDTIHKKVDRETVRWAEGRPLCLVEGRFLDAVLGGAGVLAIRLTAADQARAERGRRRFGAYSIDELRQSDTRDEIFRARMYNDRSPVLPQAILDTTKRTVEECVACVRSIIGRQCNERA
jgi:cytidylate kinase